MQSRDEQLGAALRRIAKRFSKFNESTFDWYINALIIDAARLEAVPLVEGSFRSRVQVEPPGPPHIDGMIERLLEMVTGEATGVTSPFSGQLIEAREAIADAGLPGSMMPAQAIAELAALVRKGLADPAKTLTDYGWGKSVKPNTYLPKPMSVWCRDDSTVLVHRGRVDVSAHEPALYTEELIAFATLANTTDAVIEPVTTQAPVRMLVWMHGDKRRPSLLELDDGGLLDAVRESPLELLDLSGEFGTADDPRPMHAAKCPGLWSWNGIATVTSRGEDPDLIALAGEWMPLSRSPWSPK